MEPTIYLCDRTRLAVLREGASLNRKTIKSMRVRDLLGYDIQALDTKVDLEPINEGIRFLCRGSHFNRTYNPEEPAENLLNGIIALGGYYNHKEKIFEF